jgi:hypothetical protein
VVSDSNPEHHTKSPIFIQIEGDKDKTELMLLSENGLNEIIL